MPLGKSTPGNLPTGKSSIGAPYYQLGAALQTFLKEKEHVLSLSQIIRDVSEEWSKRRQKPPVPQTFYRAVYGERPLPEGVLIFLMERYGFKLRFYETFSAMNREGSAVKANDVRMPRMRELF